MKFLLLAILCLTSFCKLSASDESAPIAVAVSGNDDAESSALIYSVREAFRNSKAFVLVSDQKFHVHILITALKVNGGLAVMVVWTYHNPTVMFDAHLSATLLVGGSGVTHYVTNSVMIDTEKTWREFVERNPVGFIPDKTPAPMSAEAFLDAPDAPSPSPGMFDDLVPKITPSPNFGPDVYLAQKSVANPFRDLREQFTVKTYEEAAKAFDESGQAKLAQKARDRIAYMKKRELIRY